MALPSSGAISISQIKTELGNSSGSLRTLSAAAGKSTPDAMSEFYGYSAAYVYNFGDDGGTTSTCCGISATSTAYASTNTPVSGTVFYSNPSLTTIFPMSGYSGLFIKFKLTSASTYTKARFNLSTSAIAAATAAC